MTGLSINSVIIDLLKSSSELTALVDSRNIVSVFINPTTFPFVSVVRNFDTNYSKDGSVEDTITLQVDIVDDNYRRGIQIAEIVRDLIENKGYKAADIYIPLIRLNHVDESLIDNTFVQTLEFTVSMAKQTD